VPQHLLVLRDRRARPRPRAARHLPGPSPLNLCVVHPAPRQGTTDPATRRAGRAGGSSARLALKPASFTSLLTAGSCVSRGEQLAEEAEQAAHAPRQTAKHPPRIGGRGCGPRLRVLGVQRQARLHAGAQLLGHLGAQPVRRLVHAEVQVERVLPPRAPPLSAATTARVMRASRAATHAAHAPQARSAATAHTLTDLPPHPCHAFNCKPYNLNLSPDPTFSSSRAGARPQAPRVHAQVLHALRLDGRAVHAVLAVQELHDRARRVANRAVVPARRAVDLLILCHCRLYLFLVCTCRSNVDCPTRGLACRWAAAQRAALLARTPSCAC